MSAVATYETIKQRFQSAATASRYPQSFGRSRRERRERDCLSRAITGLPNPSRILDLPCGNGRVAELLVELGHDVTGMDASEPMVAAAEGRVREGDLAAYADRLRFRIGDAFAIDAPNAAFDAVICHRLMHHLGTSDLRRSVLGEMARVCEGRLVVSYFDSFAVDSQRFFLKHWLSGQVPDDRIPIPAGEFAADLEYAGWTLTLRIPIRRGVSPLWIIVAERQ